MTSASEVEAAPSWATVKYRSTPVNLADFTQLNVTPEGDVEGAWWDQDAHYMIIALSGVNYHYCSFGALEVRQFEVASSSDQHYRDKIRGTHDCRVEGPIPDYGVPSSSGDRSFDREYERDEMIESLEEDLGRAFDDDLDYDVLQEIEHDLDDLQNDWEEDAERQQEFDSDYDGEE